MQFWEDVTAKSFSSVSSVVESFSLTFLSRRRNEFSEPADSWRCRLVEASRQPEPSRDHVPRIDPDREQRRIDDNIECAAERVDQRPPERLAGHRVPALRGFDDLAGDERVR